MNLGGKTRVEGSRRYSVRSVADSVKTIKYNYCPSENISFSASKIKIGSYSGLVQNINLAALDTSLSTKGLVNYTKVTMSLGGWSIRM